MRCGIPGKWHKHLNSVSAAAASSCQRHSCRPCRRTCCKNSSTSITGDMGSVVCTLCTSVAVPLPAPALQLPTGASLLLWASCWECSSTRKAARPNSVRRMITCRSKHVAEDSGNVCTRVPCMAAPLKMTTLATGVQCHARQTSPKQETRHRKWLSTTKRSQQPQRGDSKASEAHGGARGRARPSSCGKSRRRRSCL
jgi:hypothetical protein